MTPAMPQAAPPLSVRLREETRAAHEAAERGDFVRSLLRGGVSREVYARFLAALPLGARADAVIAEARLAFALHGDLAAGLTTPR